jgi:hypothetical protein
MSASSCPIAAILASDFEFDGSPTLLPSEGHYAAVLDLDAETLVVVTQLLDVTGHQAGRNFGGCIVH